MGLRYLEDKSGLGGGTHPRIRDIICRGTEASDNTMLLKVVSHLLQQDCKDKTMSRTLERQGSVDSRRSW